jgi:hypothetical protein
VSNAEFKILDFNNCRFGSYFCLASQSLGSGPEDLTNVPGIGPKTLEANKDRIVVE